MEIDLGIESEKEGGVKDQSQVLTFETNGW